jgi:hypothetical protein
LWSKAFKHRSRLFRFSFIILVFPAFFKASGLPFSGTYGKIKEKAKEAA